MGARIESWVRRGLRAVACGVALGATACGGVVGGEAAANETVGRETAANETAPPLLCAGRDVVCTVQGQTYCADLHDNRANCGVCGLACADGQVCRQGRCVATCGQRETVCGPDSAEYCADLRDDATHCGACDNACPTDQACRNGVCRLLK
jgi:hypothetical protein